jgi:hypothetical protein
MNMIYALSCSFCPTNLRNVATHDITGGNRTITLMRLTCFRQTAGLILPSFHGDATCAPYFPSNFQRREWLASFTQPLSSHQSPSFPSFTDGHASGQ